MTSESPVWLCAARQSAETGVGVAKEEQWGAFDAAASRVRLIVASLHRRASARAKDIPVAPCRKSDSRFGLLREHAPLYLPAEVGAIDWSGASRPLTALAARYEDAVAAQLRPFLRERREGSDRPRDG